MRAKRASLWTESVFHVLAHLDVGAVAASCFDRAYVAWAEAKLGPITQRPLHEDVRHLSQIAATHDVLARAQALAWVFDSMDRVTHVEERDLASLTAADVDNAKALAIALTAGPAVAEVLRAAAELEAPLLASLEETLIDQTSTRAAFDAVLPAAPSLVDCDLVLARSLGLRGRMLDASIVVGHPGIASCPEDPEHIAWQAAHEATVGAVIGEASNDLPFLEIERRAIELLRSRARRAGLSDAHGRWLARLDLRSLSFARG